jgi:hypothetical protein
MLLKSVVNQIREILFAVLCELFKPFLPFWPTSDELGRRRLIHAPARGKPLNERSFQDVDFSETECFDQTTDTLDIPAEEWLAYCAEVRSADPPDEPTCRPTIGSWAKRRTIARAMRISIRPARIRWRPTPSTAWPVPSPSIARRRSRPTWRTAGRRITDSTSHLCGCPRRGITMVNWQES